MKVRNKGTKGCSVHPVVAIDEGAAAAAGFAEDGVTQPEMDTAVPVAAIGVAAGRAGRWEVVVGAGKFEVTIAEVAAEGGCCALQLPDIGIVAAYIVELVREGVTGHRFHIQTDTI